MRRLFISAVSALTALTALSGGALPAAEPVAHRDVFYTKAKDPLQALDIYSPAEGQNHPVVVWIHHGAWRMGDKSLVAIGPKSFTQKGYVLAFINHRLLPQVTLKDSVADVAKSLRWLHEHAAEYRGDPNSIVLIGDSSGGHLAALVCTDDRYLKAEGLDLSFIKGCVPKDIPAYDVPRQIAEGGSEGWVANLKRNFGESTKNQRELSPVTHIAAGKNIPPFLLLHIASQKDEAAQARWMESKLKAAGVPVRVYATGGKVHDSLGHLDDKSSLSTQEFWKFLSQVTSPK